MMSWLDVKSCNRVGFKLSFILSLSDIAITLQRVKKWLQMMARRAGREDILQMFLLRGNFSQNPPVNFPLHMSTLKPIPILNGSYGSWTSQEKWDHMIE